MKQQAIDYINKKIEKYSKMVEKSEKIYKWNESKYTFHWWASYWYEKWKLWDYEDMKDELQALWDGWIPVTERLPKPLINHIVWHHDWMTLWVYYDWVWYWDSLQHLYNVTHWQPLPLPPNK